MQVFRFGHISSKLFSLEIYTINRTMLKLFDIYSKFLWY